MEKQEHLNRIKAKCLANLALADKRTQGKWLNSKHTIGSVERHFIGLNPVTTIASINTNCLAYSNGSHDASFIATCAGPAEAGWRSTIAAIDALLEYEREELIIGDAVVNAIIAAWPEELL